MPSATALPSPSPSLSATARTTTSSHSVPRCWPCSPAAKADTPAHLALCTSFGIGPVALESPGRFQADRGTGDHQPPVGFQREQGAEAEGLGEGQSGAVESGQLPALVGIALATTWKR
jgi:hypothetical protein